LKTVREAMDIMDAYQTVGSYRGAAELCGTTHKTVKRVVERRGRDQVGRRRTQPTKVAPVVRSEAHLEVVSALSAQLGPALEPSAWPFSSAQNYSALSAERWEHPPSRGSPPTHLLTP